MAQNQYAVEGRRGLVLYFILNRKINISHRQKWMS